MANRLIKTLYLDKFVIFRNTLRVKAISTYPLNSY